MIISFVLMFHLVPGFIIVEVLFWHELARNSD